MRITDRGWERLLGKYGPTAAIAVFLVWWISNDVSGTLRAIEFTLNTHVSESVFYLRAICLNAAKDERERANCVPPEGR